MNSRKFHACFVIFFIVLFVDFVKATPTHSIDEVALRMIGHEVLRNDGDSVSLILPIEKERKSYTIRFERPFSFEPEEFSATVDSILSAFQFDTDYLVEVISCDSNLIVYSYEFLGDVQFQPCGGRVYPRACYFIRITSSVNDAAFVGTIEPLDSDNFDFTSEFEIFAVILVLLIALTIIVWRRKNITQVDETFVQLGDFKFDKRNMVLLSEKQRINLTGKETELLQLLLSSLNDTVAREAILNAVWRDEGDYVGRTLDVFISKLRRKLEADSNIRIVNIRGVGYKLVVNGKDTA